MAYIGTRTAATARLSFREKSSTPPRPLAVIGLGKAAVQPRGSDALRLQRDLPECGAA